jgi:hypothetical protein
VDDIRTLISKLNAAPEESPNLALISQLAQAIAGIDASRGIRLISSLRSEPVAAQVCLVVISIFSERGTPGLGRIYAEAFESVARDSDETMPCFGHIHLAGLTQRSEYLEGALNYFRRASLERRCISLACVIICKNQFANLPILLMQAKCEFKQAVSELREAGDKKIQRFTSAMAKAVACYSDNLHDALRIISELDGIAPCTCSSDKVKEALPN